MKAIPSDSTRIALALVAQFLLAPAHAASAPGPSDSGREIDRIVAIVNDDVITETELDRRLEQTKKQLALQGIAVPPDPVLQKQVLERMTVERIQLQIAQHDGIRPTDSEVDQAIESIAQRNKMPVERFMGVLKREGLDPAAYRGEIRNQIAIRQLLEREINSRITVSESEVSNFLENLGDKAAANVEYKLAHIYVGVPEAASTEAIQKAKALADEIHSKLEHGEDFERAAVTYSQGSDALKGGVLGWRKAGQLPDLFLAALGKMRPGDVTDVLRGPNGFHIVKLIDQRGGLTHQSVVQTHVRHILLRPSEIQSLGDAKGRLLALRERIQNGEDFAALARANSEDAVSAANGGDLGWVDPGQLTPTFEKVMNALKAGELSDPVETPFGVHLIQVLGRRDRDVTEERVRANARQQIHARKADARYEQWVRQLRDEAYVEYYLEDVN